MTSITSIPNVQPGNATTPPPAPPLVDHEGGLFPPPFGGHGRATPRPPVLVDHDGEVLLPPFEEPCHARYCPPGHHSGDWFGKGPLPTPPVTPPAAPPVLVEHDGSSVPTPPDGCKRC